MKAKLFKALLLLIAMSAVSQTLTATSPNQKISVSLFTARQVDTGERYLKVSYHRDTQISEVIPRINLGLIREDQGFSKDFKFLKAGKSTTINENYSALHGKHEKSFITRYLMVDETSKLDVKLLRRGGFAANLTPLN